MRGTWGSTMGAGVAALVWAGCGADPSSQMDESVGYRNGQDGGATSGERGTVKITEILWSGSVRGDGPRDPADIFIELRNESHRDINISGWRLVFDGPLSYTLRVPENDLQISTGQHIFIAAKNTGCFPQPDIVMPDLRLQDGDPFEITLLDADERLMESVGNPEAPPYAGGWDHVRSRSMERVELMFGGEGFFPQAWHFYTPAAVDVPNTDRIDPGCLARTYASPGRPNSPDYSGAYASGSLE